MKIALAQLNYLIGDFRGTCQRWWMPFIGPWNRELNWWFFQNLSICGYPPLDLLERKDFIDTCNLYIKRLAESIDPGIGVLIGGPEFNPRKEGKLLYNSVFLSHGGKVQQVFRKTLLPTYDIFDEYRYFEPNREFKILEFKGKRLAVTICEDLWDEQPFESEFSRSRLYTANPLEEMSRDQSRSDHQSGCFSICTQENGGKTVHIYRKGIARYGIPVLYCNQVGAQTELIFEGGSLAINSAGEVVRRLNFFQEDFESLTWRNLI